MISVQLIYENGIFRPKEPLALPDGTQVEALLLTSEAALDEDIASDILDRIAALPLEGVTASTTSRDYEAVLYPKQGTMP